MDPKKLAAFIAKQPKSPASVKVKAKAPEKSHPAPDEQDDASDLDIHGFDDDASDLDFDDEEAEQETFMSVAGKIDDAVATLSQISESIKNLIGQHQEEGLPQDPAAPPPMKQAPKPMFGE